MTETCNPIAMFNLCPEVDRAVALAYCVVPYAVARALSERVKTRPHGVAYLRASSVAHKVLATKYLSSALASARLPADHLRKSDTGPGRFFVLGYRKLARLALLGVDVEPFLTWVRDAEKWVVENNPAE